ncbi:MAG: tetratricopeptide repeat protein [Cyclobacteriaceae bacterium]|nr:tetratricopeptide repeat protein [Cyclobacteriaceae bacterium]
MKRREIIGLLALGCVVLFTLFTLFESCSSPSEQKQQEDNNLHNTEATFIGSVACQSCHTKEFKDWKKSDHFLAMDHATDSTVLGDFENTTFKADGITSSFFKKDGKFYMNTEGDDGKNHDYEVKYVFGYYPLQQYLIAFPGGRLQSTRLSWDSRNKKWFHQYTGEKIHHTDWLHWTGNSQNWNTMCASCHSTNLQKNYDFTKDTYNTTWSEINVSCESCHGPGSQHISFINTPEYKAGTRIKNAGLQYGKNTDPQLLLNTCAPCHARKTDLTSKFLHTDEIMDNMIPQIISTEFYFADGQINDEDYEYSSFVQSKMFHNNVRCSSCHNPHSGKLIATGNTLCMSCHKPEYNTEKHHFHAINTEGAQCINCHMQTKTYMGNDHRRDHSFRIPRPDQSVKFGTPNACTTCHQNKKPSWAADAVTKWYGPTRTYHFSDDLIPGSKLDDQSEKHLLKLVADTLQPEIARATAVHYLGNMLTQESATALVRALQDKKPLVRYHAVQALENFPPEVWQSVALQNLSDNVRAVRIATADLYHRLPAEAIPPAYRNAYAAADHENRKFLHYQTDFAVGNVMLADYELQGGEHLNAITLYIRGLKKDSLMNYARLNLSAAYNSIGKNAEALKTLTDAASIDPKNDRVFYNLGLLHYEMNNLHAAVENFQKAVRLGSTNTSLYYNYGLLLQQQGKLKEAEQVLLSGYSLNQQAANINYALAYLYANQNLPQKARVHALTLQKVAPHNPEYQGLFRSLGI